jgi:hypothetical protein
MLNFFNIVKAKPKPLKIRFFTQNYGLVETVPPMPLNKCVPDWWRDTDSLIDHQSGKVPLPEEAGTSSNPSNLRFRPKKLNKSVKHCYSIQKTLELGIAFPLWADYVIAVDDKGGVSPYGPNPNVNRQAGEQHPKVQYPGLLSADHCNWKFNSPWVAYTEEPCFFYMTNPFYHMKSRDWEAMPGVIEFFYQHNLNVNTILRVPKSKDSKKRTVKEYDFKVGTILNYWIPMVEQGRKVEIETLQITEHEWKKLHFGFDMYHSNATEHRKNGWGGCPFEPKGHPD